MKTIYFFFLSACISALSLQGQGRVPKATPPPPPQPPPVFVAPAPPSAPAQTYVYEQKPVSGRSYLVTPEQAQDVINRFQEAYSELGNPRLLIYVNRALVDESSGLQLSARSEESESIRGHIQSEPNPSGAARANTNQSGGSITLGNLQAGGNGPFTGRVDRVTAKNTFRVRDKKTPSLTDRQTVRDVERLFGRPLRMAGAALVDQRLATQMMTDKSIENFTASASSEQAAKDREAVAKIADVVLEVLISSRDIVVPEISGNKTYSVPDIQATAIRLKDSQIIAQASSSDLIGQGVQAGRAARNFDVREITEATALSLMEDLMLGK